MSSGSIPDRSQSSVESVAYRAQPRRIRPTRGRTGSDSLASRVALARALSRPAPKRTGGMVPLFLGMVVLGIAVVFAGGGVVAGGTASATLAALAADLPEVSRFEQLRFAQPTVVYDRTGTVELARFQAERRDVVTFEEVPDLVLDATIAVEDRSFWSNEGYDPNAIASAVADLVSGGGDRGGGSTITQQFVRSPQVGLLPAHVLEPGSDTLLRKGKEIIQAANLTEFVTEAYGPEEGKERIVTAYLNQIFYGHSAYGIAAAADVYFGKEMAELTPAEAALLAGLPQSPSTLDPYRFAEEDASGRLIVPTCGSDPEPGCEDVPPIVRRDFILRSLADGFGRWTTLTEAQLEAALDEPVVLIGEQPIVFKAPHFVWAMKADLDLLLSDREPAETGGYRIITTLDMEAQSLGEKFIEAATILPQMDAVEYDQAIEGRNLRQDREWIDPLRGMGIHNGAMSALDYKTGDILAYVGSAGYYREDIASEKFDPKFDVAAGFRQPGSAFKPVLYATAFDERALTPGSLLLDATTSFAREWQPKNADMEERGPVLVRDALKYSLNVPAIRAIDRVGPAAVGEASARAGMNFLGGPDDIAEGGLASAIGTVEVRLVELTATFGAFGNGGVVTAPRTILEVQDENGATIFQADEPVTNRVWSPQAAWLTADILKDNTDPAENFIWGPNFELNNGPDGAYRPAAVKTGTTNEIKDLTTYGLLPLPNDPAEPALAVGVWLGNSDYEPPTVGDAEIFGTQGPGQVWRAFLREYMEGKPVADFERPDKGLVEATIDGWSGGTPGEWTRATEREWFITGTEPGSSNAIDEPGLLYRRACGGRWFVDPLQAERDDAPDQWRTDVRSWTERARRGTGIRHPEYGTLTTYMWGADDWGGPLIPADPVGCAPPSPSFGPFPSGGLPTPEPDPTEEPERTARPDPTREPRPDPTRTPRPDPTRTPRPDPTRTPRPDPTRTPRPDPTRTPRPDPTRTPRPDPTETPAPEPTPTADPGGGGEEPPGEESGGQQQPTPPDSDAGTAGEAAIYQDRHHPAALPAQAASQRRMARRRRVAHL